MKKLAFFLLIVTMLFSCRKDTDIIDPPVGPSPNIVVNTSVLGQVIGNNGQGIAEAIVNFENNTVTTDDNGFFFLNEKELYQDGTFLTAHKDGFITGSRLFYPSVNQTSNIVIQLIEKSIVGTVSSTQGGKIEFDNATVDFPANGFMNEDGSEYNGTVNVYGKWLNPENPATFREMPGDLVGINTDSDVRALASYGMLAVELEDESGNKLQIKEGNTAAISVPVPSSLMNAAPSQIPLWHFDMEVGYWIEEGEATLVNGIYEGEVSHFSFWNCDVPFPFINLDGTVLLNGLGLANVKVIITNNDNGTSACGFTTDRGYYNGKVPQDADLSISIQDECGNSIYSGSLGSFSVDTTVPLINAFTANNPVTISGSVNNCTGQNIDVSYATLKFDNGTIKSYPTDANGNFSFVIANCNSAEAEIFGVDVTNNLVSNGVLITFVNDVNVGVLEACDSFLTDKVIGSYIGSEWNHPIQGDTISSSYNVVIESGQLIHELSYINWFTGELVFIEIHLPTGSNTAIQWNADFSDVGFQCSGTNAPSGIIQNPQGQKFLLLQATATTADITITDPNIFDPNITEVTLDIAIQIN